MINLLVILQCITIVLLLRKCKVKDKSNASELNPPPKTPQIHSPQCNLITREEWIQKYSWPNSMASFYQFFLNRPQIKNKCLTKHKGRFYLKEDLLKKEILKASYNSSLFRKFQDELNQGL